MGFKGDLSTISLADIFQTLSATQKQGTLNVGDGESVKAIYFGHDGVRLLSSGRRRLLRLGEILVQAGRITQAQLDTALSLQKETGAKLGEVLVQLGLVREEEIERFVRGQIEEEIYDLFTWKEAQFEFVDGPPTNELTATGVRPTALAFDIQGLLLEAARRLDEWAMIERALPHIRALLAATGVGKTEGLDDAARAVLSHVDGSKSIHDIVDATLSSRFYVCKSVSSLIEAGCVRALSPDEASGELTKAVSNGELDRAIGIARNLVHRDPNDLETLSQLAAALKAAGKLAEAADEYKRLGTRLRADENWVNAAKAFGFAVECAPEDRASLRDQVDALGRAGKCTDAVTCGKRLIEVLIAEGRSPEAVEAGRLLATLAPRDPNAHLLLSDALLAARKKDDALGVLLSARAQVPMNEVDMIAEIDRRIQALDPSRAPQPVTKKRTRPSGRRRSAVVGLLLVLALAAGVWKLDEDAKRDLEDAKATVAALVAERKWDQARAVYDRVRAEHRIGFIGDALDEAVRQLDAARRRVEGGGQEHPEIPGEAALTKAQKDAEALEERGEFDAAIRAWQGLESLARKADNEEVIETAKNGAQRVERHVKESEDLLERVARSEDQKDYSGACGLVLRLRRDYPLTAAAKKSAYPVLVESSPAGADVLVDGRKVGKTPTVVHLVPQQHEVVLLDLAGYPSVSRHMDTLLAGEFKHSFARIVRGRASLGSAIEATPMLVDGTVWVATRSGEFVLLDHDPLMEKSRIKVDRSAISRCVQRVGTFVLAGTDDARLHAVSTQDGRIAWTADMGTPLRLPVAVLSEAGCVVSGGADARVRAVSLASGQPLWVQPLPSPVSSTPGVWRGLAVVVTDSGTLLALEPSKGETSFRIEGLPPVLGRVVVDQDRLYGAGSDGRVVAVDLAKRQVAWSVRLASGAPGGVALSEGRLLLGLGNGAVVSLSPVDGATQWSCATGGTVSIPPVATKDTVYSGSDDGFVYAIGAADGQVRWRFEVGAKVRSGVLIGTGLIYFGADDGRVYAVEP